jgi:hypothetical protein
MKRKGLPLVMVVVFSLLLMLGTATAQEAEPAQETEPAQEVEPAPEAEPSKEAESAPEAAAGTDFVATVKFTQLQKASLEGSAGEIDVLSVEFEVAGAKGGGIKGAFSSGDSDMEAIITTRITCKTSAETKVKFDMMVEFLDTGGQVIDRAMSSDSFKKNQKTFDIKHTTLRWAVDHIDQARITVKVKE